MYEIKKHYRHDEALRHSFNALAEKTFGLNFENWYRNGFWGDSYDPYSVVEDGKVVANVSVNRTDMVIGGQRKRLVQLGTVMTEESHRNRGLIRAILAEVERDCAGADGMYLFGNDSVVDFYPKFGFRRGKEYIYTKAVAVEGPCQMKNIPMDGPEAWAKLAAAMEKSTFRSGCDMVDNPGLIFFYVSQFMSGCVYYSENLDAWAIAGLEDGNLTLHNVFGGDLSIDTLAAAFGSQVRTVTLGFAPADPAGWRVEEFHEEDCTFFVKGTLFEDFEKKNLRIPTLAHA